MANGEGSIKLIASVAGLMGTALGMMISWATAIGNIDVLTERVGHLNTQIQAGMDDRYRSSDAKKDFLLVQQQISQNAKQIEELHSMMRTHDTDTRKHNGRDYK